MLDLELLDYQELNFKIAEKYPNVKHHSFTKDELTRIPKLRLQLKNVVMHYLMQVR